MSSPAPSVVHLLAAAAADTHTPAVLELLAADPDRLVALAAEHHDVRDGERRLLLDDATTALLSARLLMALDDVQSLDEHVPVVGRDARYLTALPALAAGHHQHRIALFDLELRRHLQRTSGASEMIFMNFLARSSRATGPKMRVPIGSF